MDIKVTPSEAYKHYLEKCHIDEAKIHPIQAKETKQAFYGGYAYCFKVLTDLIGTIDNEEIVFKLMDNINNELSDFFK